MAIRIKPEYGRLVQEQFAKHRKTIDAILREEAEFGGHSVEYTAKALARAPTSVKADLVVVALSRKVSEALERGDLKKARLALATARQILNYMKKDKNISPSLIRKREKQLGGYELGL